MISVIIAVRDAEEELLRSLAALASASVAGIVADVVIADRGSRDATLDVADAAGCAIVENCSGHSSAIERAAAAARKPWLLALAAGDLPSEAVMRAALDHIARAAFGTARPAAFLAPPAGALRRAALGRCFGAFGWSRPEHRRVLAPRGDTRALTAAGWRWKGARLRPPIERVAVR